MRFESNFQDEYIRSTILSMTGDCCYCFVLLVLLQLRISKKKDSNKNILIENGGDAQGQHE